jgi:hypothetical protein
MTDKTEESYANYLKTEVQNHESPYYEILLDILWQKEFYSVLPNDQNRAEDGLMLRDGVFYEGRELFGPCRMLEMLIALSKRMEWNISGTGYDVDYVDLFWEFLDNLDLLIFTDSNVTEENELEIHSILLKFLERQYLSDGRGSIFPIKNWRRGVYKPQHKIELWYQMMQYLSINYPF